MKQNLVTACTKQYIQYKACELILKTTAFLAYQLCMYCTIWYTQRQWVIPPPQLSFLTFCFLFPISSWVFAVEQFKIPRWKANVKTNLMIVSEIKIERLQSKKLLNMFEPIQKMKKSQAIIFNFPFSFRHIFASFCRRIISITALES